MILTLGIIDTFPSVELILIGLVVSVLVVRRFSLLRIILILLNVVGLVSFIAYFPNALVFDRVSSTLVVGVLVILSNVRG
ncbi:hypothetical protein PPACK8108_LOCUS23702 [Phakopsora pachyrhizi]|uniref:Uncharacterized protein n=1 Tax=Phakopsora pachyrhizi TaxID=170000 RepID=A0AAV0BR83_PHAPC|nr:hypothetical protein PPACK8108_LOCUS23702 [Phakopsora pachyrhizi]